MTDSCPEDFRDPIIQSKCLRQSEPASYHLDLPVHSLLSNKVQNENYYQCGWETHFLQTYANVFCALCNDDASKLAPFNVSLRCNNLDLIDRCDLDIVSNVLLQEGYVKVRFFRIEMPCDQSFFCQGELRWTKYLKPGRDMKAECSGGASYTITCEMAIEHNEALKSRVRPCLNQQVCSKISQLMTLLKV